MKIIDCAQNSPEWFQARCGMVTASEFKSVMAKGQGKTRKRYMNQLLAERISGRPFTNGYQSNSMDYGSEIEDEARANYELKNMVDVDRVGFVVSRFSENIGASPDGLIANDGGCELKCPESHTHIEYLLSRKVPSQYVAQIQGNMWVCERDWWDFVSYDKRVVGRELFVVRVYRDDEYIKNMQSELLAFVNELLIYEEQLRNN